MTLGKPVIVDYYIVIVWTEISSYCSQVNITPGVTVLSMQTRNLRTLVQYDNTNQNILTGGRQAKTCLICS